MGGGETTRAELGLKRDWEGRKDKGGIGTEAPKKGKGRRRKGVKQEKEKKTKQS